MKMLSFHNALFGREEQDVLLQLDASSVSSGIHLMIAPNGSGKSTFLQTVGGVLTLKSGHFKLDSRRFVPHKQGLYFSEYLSFPKFIYPEEWIDFVSRNDQKADWRCYVQGLGIERQMNSFLGRMSQGERRKVGWLAAVASNRDVLLLDEPLDGVDFLALRTIRDILSRWKNEQKIILMAVHQFSTVLELVDEIYLIKDQKLVSYSEVFSKSENWNWQEVEENLNRYYQPEISR